MLAPAPGLDAETAIEAQALGLRLAAELDVTGLLAVELFETRRGLLVNEVAMRPHNSGHWTIEGAGDLAVRAAPAGRAEPAAGRDDAGRARARDGEHPGRRRPPACATG